MVRKMLSVLVLGVVGLFAFGGAASAQPAIAYPPTPPPTTVVINVTVNITIINNGTIIIFSGSGFNFLEDILISAINTGGPSGLRSSPALANMAAGTMPTTADAAGNFSADVTSLINAPGDWELTATGLVSGKSARATVTKSAATAPAYITGGGGSTGSSYTSADALASTGASVAGPIAIGAAALLAGLAMLFFGTRGVIRRKSSRSGGTV